MMWQTGTGSVDQVLVSGEGRYVGYLHIKNTPIYQSEEHRELWLQYGRCGGKKPRRTRARQKCKIRLVSVVPPAVSRCFIPKSDHIDINEPTAFATEEGLDAFLAERKWHRVTVDAYRALQRVNSAC